MRSRAQREVSLEGVRDELARSAGETGAS
jgi:hypothetical protein